MSFQAELLSYKKENERIQIRRVQREEVFKQKRIIQSQEIPKVANENVGEFVEAKMIDCIRIYNHLLPQQMSELVQNIIQIKSVLLDNVDQFITAVFKKDFIQFLLIFLREQYDQQAIQYHAALILANFFGMISPKNNHFLTAYIPLLNYKGGQIVGSIGRLLLSKNEELIEAAIFALGNLFCDQSCIVDEFRKQFGMNLILQLNSTEVIWILQLLFENRVFFSVQELNDAILILDNTINNANNTDYVIKQALTALQYGSIYLTDLQNIIPRLNCFQILIQRKQFTTLCQISRISDANILLKVVKNYDYIDLIAERLGSRSKEEQAMSLKTLVRLARKDNILAKHILVNKYTSEKIIAIASQQDGRVILYSLKWITAMLYYRDMKITAYLLDKNLIPLLSKVMDIMNPRIVNYALKALCYILDLKDDFPAFNDKNTNIKTKLEIGQLFCHNQLADRIFTAYSNLPEVDMKLIERVLTEINSFEEVVQQS